MPKANIRYKKVVRSAVREVRSAHNEMNWEIAESTAEERMLANKHEMSIHKLKASNQGSPMNEKNPSTEVDHNRRTNSVNEQHKNSDKQSVPTMPSSGKNNGNEKSEGIK